MSRLTLLLVITLIVGSVLIQSVQAVAEPDCTKDASGNPQLCNPLGSTGGDIASVIHAIVNWLMLIAAPIAVGFIIWGALQMIFAAGTPEKFENGKKTILYTLVGYVIILIGWGITDIIKSLLAPSS